MLKKLRIKNIVLIDLEEVDFHEGYNVISGETGAGKSALLEALKLICGGKFEPELLRHGTTSGFVEAVFQVNDAAKIHLECAGLLGDFEECIVRRELVLSKKSRSFINDRLVSADFLKTLLDSLLEIVSQKATFLFQDPLYQQTLFDDYAGVTLFSFQKAFSTCRTLEEKASNKEETLYKLSLELGLIKDELQELKSLKIIPGEDETLFKEYARQVSLQEQQALIEEIDATFSLESLNQCRRPLQNLIKINSEAQALLEQFEEHLQGLLGIQSELFRQAQLHSFDPHHFEKVASRLTTVEKIKKRYGGSLEVIPAKITSLAMRADNLEREIASFDLLEDEIREAKKRADTLAKELSEKRALAAHSLKKTIEKSLHELNMPSAEFEAKLLSGNRSVFGDERVQFCARTNRGDKWLVVAESTSGGELARLLLAFRLATAAKKGGQSLFFDEIDAHIGGETAQLVGKKLRELASHQQVIVITHFPQVAHHAHHHLTVKKIEKESGTFTKISLLTRSEIEQELSRMKGIP